MEYRKITAIANIKNSGYIDAVGVGEAEESGLGLRGGLEVREAALHGWMLGGDHLI